MPLERGLSVSRQRLSALLLVVGTDCARAQCTIGYQCGMPTFWAYAHHIYLPASVLDEASGLVLVLGREAC